MKEGRVEGFPAGFVGNEKGGPDYKDTLVLGGGEVEGANFLTGYGPSCDGKAGKNQIKVLGLGFPLQYSMHG